MKAGRKGERKRRKERKRKEKELIVILGGPVIS